MDAQEPPGSDQTSEKLDNISRPETNAGVSGSSQSIGEEKEVTFPNNPVEADTNSSANGDKQARRSIKFSVLGIAGVLLLGLISYGSYAYGYSRGRDHQTSVDGASAIATSLQVPKGATIIEQCDAHKGTQYVLPSNIPHGPVYNVYKGKVIGIEYMIGKQDLANDDSFYDLPLFGQKYNHMNIGLLSQGHAGYPEPHYHVDLYTVSYAAEQAITCK